MKYFTAINLLIGTLLLTLNLTEQVKAQVPVNNLVGYYPFNGNANDASPNSNNGIVNGPSLTSDRFGNPNSAYLFNGSSDWINLGDGSSLHYNQSSNKSFSVWFNSNSGSNGQNLVRYDDLDNGDGDTPNPRHFFMFRLTNSDNDGDFNIQHVYGEADPLNTLNWQEYTGDSITTNDWHHLVAIKDNAKDSSFIYLNGQLISKQQDGNIGTWETTGQYMMLGRYNYNGTCECFSGVMDDIRFYDMALTQCEVLALYHEGDVTYNTVTKNNNILTANTTGVNYQWLDCNNNYAVISGANNQIYTPTLNGSYACQVSQYGCLDTSACVAVTNVGIEESNQLNFSLYPNPTQSEVTINLGDTQGVNLRILDVVGKVLFNQANLNQSKVIISLEKYSPGVYFIELNVDNKVQTLKLLKK